MRTLLNNLALAAALASTSAAAQTLAPVESFYTAGSQYTASFNQTNGHWRLSPAAGQDIEIGTGLCPTGTVIPDGLWLLVREGQGPAELVAPSSTPLPAGRADRVALRPCDQAGDNQLALPQPLIDLLANQSGAVLVYGGNAHD